VARDSEIEDRSKTGIYLDVTFFKTRPGNESFCGIIESFGVANDGVLWCIDYRRVGVGDVHSIQENEAAKMQSGSTLQRWRAVRAAKCALVDWTRSAADHREGQHTNRARDER